MTSRLSIGKREIAWGLLSAAAGYLLWKNRLRIVPASQTLEPGPPLPSTGVVVETSAGPTPQDKPGMAPLPRDRGAAVPDKGFKTYVALMINAAKAWSSHRAASKGAALALYTLFSLAPMLLLVVALAGFFFGADTVSQALLDQIRDLVGAQGAEAVRTMLENSQDPSDGLLAGAISLILLLVGATSAFAELKDSLDELWEVRQDEGGGLWTLLRERFLSFGLILVLVLMLMVSLVVSTVLAALGDLMNGLASEASFQFLTQSISAAVSFLIVSALFAAIYKYLPETPIAWRDVIVGALITAVLFTLGKVLIGLYLGNGGVSNAYGAAGSVVVLITWIYYSAQIFFYGALFTHEYATRVGSHAGAEKPGR